MSPSKDLDVADYAVFAVLTAVGYIVGLYFSFARRRERVAPENSAETTAALEAFLGSRSLPAVALAVSVLASAVNGMNLVPSVGYYYAHGFHVAWLIAWIPAASLFAAFALVPLLYRLRVAAIFQYLRLRFDNKVGITACIIYFVLSQTLGAVGIYGAALAVSTMLSVPLVYTNIAIGFFGTIYTALGGLRSVVWADCIQALVMVASPVTIIIKIIYDSNRANPPLRAISEFNMTQYVMGKHLDITTDDNTWTAVAASLPYALVRVGFDQMAVQRFMSARTLREARWIAVVGAVLLIAFYLVIILATVGIIYWYRDCDPLLYGGISSYDQIVPYYLRESLPEVTMLRGIFLAGLVSASTSTVSSVVNTHAATFYIDVIGPFVKMTDRKAVVLMRLLAFGSGTIMTIFAIFLHHFGSAIRMFMALYSSGSGPYVGLLLLAISSPWVTAKGAAWASLLVCGLQLWHALGRSLSGFAPSPFFYGTLDRCESQRSTIYGANITSSSPDSAGVFPLYQLSFFWISLIGAVLTFVLGTAFSLVRGDAKSSRKHVQLTSSIFLKLWGRVKFLRRKLKLHGNGRKAGITSLLEPAGEEHSALRTAQRIDSGTQIEETELAA